MLRARRRTGSWVTGWFFAVLLLAAAAIYNFANLLGIERWPVVAAFVAPRNATTVVIAGIAVLALVFAVAARGIRPIALPVALSLIVGVAFSAGVMFTRGIRDDAPAAYTASDIRVLSWNTNTDLVQPDVIVDLAKKERANVVVMPAIPSWGGRSAYTNAFAAAGMSMTAFPDSSDLGSETVVMIANSLGSYQTDVTHGPRKNSSVAVTPSASSPDAPYLMAIHAAKPTLRSNAAWNADIDWITAGCSRPDTIAIGDFNSTIDSFGESRLGGCRDAASVAHAASVGSWPTWAPTWLAMPIDHVLVGSDWRVRSFTVLTDEDHSGARHRPILAVLSRAS